MVNIADNIKKDTLYQSAIHESGHVILGKILNVPFEEKDIAAALSNSEGPVTYVNDIIYCSADFKELVFFIIVLLAGRVAEEIEFGESCKKGLADDEMRINKCIEEISYRKKQKYELGNEAESLLRKIIFENIELIEIIASDLYGASGFCVGQ